MKILLLLVWLPFAICASAQGEGEHKKLEYMSDGNVAKAIEFALANNRPILLYFNSIDCHGCEVFSSEIMASDTVVQALKNKYVCVNASVETHDGRKYSKKYKVFNLPQLVLVTPDQKVHYIK